MSGIRALERADLPPVAALFEQVMGSVEGFGTSRLADYFARSLLDDPWYDEELPPLVYEAPDGAIVGFIGSSTRRMRLDGRPIRMVVSSNLVAHPDWRSRGVGARLNKRLLDGPQELTIADRAGEDARKLWVGLRGQEMVGASVGWYRILRPGAAAGALLGTRGGPGGLLRGIRLAGAPVDALARRVPRVATTLEPPVPEGTTEPLAPDGLREQVERAGRDLRLHPDYDDAFLRWAFGELDALRARGPVVARVVHGPSGRVAGWFLYQLLTGGTAHVLQLGVAGSDPEPVLDHLFRHAYDEGAALVHGRLEPSMAGVLDRSAVVVRRSARALVHAADPAVLGLLGTTRSLCSHLDGEWLVSHARRQGA